jgi:AraC-like DNA-binding protein
LEERIADIPDVQTWASEAGVSRRWLCKSMKAVYGSPPKVILREMKYEKVVWLICDEGLEAGCFKVAVDAGFYSVSGLSKFLSTYHDTNFTCLKTDLLTKMG